MITREKLIELLEIGTEEKDSGSYLYESLCHSKLVFEKEEVVAQRDYEESGYDDGASFGNSSTWSCRLPRSSLELLLDDVLEKGIGELTLKTKVNERYWYKAPYHRGEGSSREYESDIKIKITIENESPKLILYNPGEFPKNHDEVKLSCNYAV